MPPLRAAQSDDFLLKYGEHAHRASLSAGDGASLD
jgi:hypothetical protein